jgi:hypothetical protein
MPRMRGLGASPIRAVAQIDGRQQRCMLSRSVEVPRKGGVDLTRDRDRTTDAQFFQQAVTFLHCVYADACIVSVS